MLTPALRKIMFAAVTAVPVILVSGPSNGLTTTEALPDNGMPGTLRSAFFQAPQLSNPLSKNCIVKVASYFNDDNLKTIDRKLGVIDSFVRKHGLYNETAENLSGQDWDLPTLNRYYVPGKKTDWLTADPRNVVQAIQVYLDHAYSLKAPGSRFAGDVESELGETLRWLVRVSLNTQDQMSQQKADGCVPAQP